MSHLRGIETFVRAVEGGSIAAAARQLALGGMRPAGDAGATLGKEAAEALADLSPEQKKRLRVAVEEIKKHHELIANKIIEK